MTTPKAWIWDESKKTWQRLFLSPSGRPYIRVRDQKDLVLGMIFLTLGLSMLGFTLLLSPIWGIVCLVPGAAASFFLFRGGWQKTKGHKGQDTRDEELLPFEPEIFE